MGFWDNLNLIKFNQTHLVPKIDQNNDDGRQQKNQNIFSNLLQEVPKDTFEKSYKRLNDTDSNILNKNMVQYLPTDSLRIELQIEKAENSLKDVDKEINSIKLLELDKNGNKIAQLEEKKGLINKEIQDYRSQYRELGLIYKITDIVTDGYNKAKDKFQEAKVAFTGRSLITKAKKLIPGLQEREELREILNKLDALQTNTEKVFSTKTNPIGENHKYFNEITILMTKANKLDAQTSKFLDSTKKAKLKITEIVKNTYSQVINSAKNTYIKATEKLKILKDKINLP
ncbi:MAG: hypothetical protein A2287_01435 [Candidatus Melainabacteria bacterium RIFOXYA12_FULL_32_12]|nr:MAG: hypothetical protein A2255_10655 [Candidatus Melainabacteria bacterium RIFOXYA2_FULL_32_9]OGI28383.1 MAG: hypothetical protein A2287_01435 [Candidatus Melainabacteria bacterium RIFOXYA12_FULL_32_12]